MVAKPFSRVADNAAEATAPLRFWWLVILVFSLFGWAAAIWCLRLLVKLLA